jgi:hypothetical protein
MSGQQASRCSQGDGQICERWLLRWRRFQGTIVSKGWNCLARVHKSAQEWRTGQTARGGQNE